jgi:hydroxymethylbilane synthase
MRALVLGTRASALAMRQAQIVQSLLESLEAGRPVELRPMTTRGDEQPDVPLATLGEGEGVFVKALEAALLAGTIDAAVHSMKDLPLDIDPRLRIAAVLAREDARDALVARGAASLDALPAGARVGTSSVRRQSQLRRRRDDLQIEPMRGNVDTRLRKLDEGRYDAIVLAAAGLLRLGLSDRISAYLAPGEMLPEPGQGAIAVEVRAEDQETTAMFAALDEPESRACVEAERSFLRALGGGCRVPIGALAEISGSTLRLEGAVLSPDGAEEIRGRTEGPAARAEELGRRLAEELSSRGAASVLAKRGA